MKNLTAIMLSVLLLAFFSCKEDKEEVLYSLEVDKTELNFAADGTSEDNMLIITSNLEWRLVIPDEVDWIVCSSTEGTGNATVEFGINDNGIDPSRSTTICLESVNGLAKTVPIKIIQAESDIHVSDYIGDAAFKVYCEQFDTDQDGKLSQAEALAVAEIDVSKKQVKSLKGIELFPSLRVLNCSENAILTLDVSKNALLEELYCSKNPIGSLDVSKNKQLKMLYCNYNELENLDVSSNPALEKLELMFNSISALDVSHNTVLIHLRCSANSIEKLDISNNTKLKSLFCTNNSIKTIDVSNNKELNLLYVDRNLFTDIDLSHNTELQSLSCRFIKQLESLDISQNKKLTLLECDGNPLLSTVYVWSGFDTANPKNTLTEECLHDTHTQFVVKP